MADIQAGAFHRKNKTSHGFEKLTITAISGGVALTSAVYGTCRYAEIAVESGPLRFTCDGTPPTFSIGHRVDPPDVIELESHEDIVNFRAIRIGTVDAIATATYQEMKLTA